MYHDLSPEGKEFYDACMHAKRAVESKDGPYWKIWYKSSMLLIKSPDHNVFNNIVLGIIVNNIVLPLTDDIKENLIAAGVRTFLRLPQSVRKLLKLPQSVHFKHIETVLELFGCEEIEKEDVKPDEKAAKAEEKKTDVKTKEEKSEDTDERLKIEMVIGTTVDTKVKDWLYAIPYPEPDGGPYIRLKWNPYTDLLMINGLDHNSVLHEVILGCCDSYDVVHPLTDELKHRLVKIGAYKFMVMDRSLHFKTIHEMVEKAIALEKTDKEKAEMKLEKTEKETDEKMKLENMLMVLKLGKLEMKLKATEKKLKETEKKLKATEQQEIMDLCKRSRLSDKQQEFYDACMEAEPVFGDLNGADWKIQFNTSQLFIKSGPDSKVFNDIVMGSIDEGGVVYPLTDDIKDQLIAIGVHKFLKLPKSVHCKSLENVIEVFGDDLLEVVKV